MNFNKEFSDSLKNKIPKKIKDLGYEFFNPSKGLVRFNNDKYKKGNDPALDKVLDKLKKNPGGLDSSGFGNRWKV